MFGFLLEVIIFILCFQGKVNVKDLTFGTAESLSNAHGLLENIYQCLPIPAIS